MSPAFSGFGWEVVGKVGRKLISDCNLAPFSSVQLEYCGVPTEAAYVR